MNFQSVEAVVGQQDEKGYQVKVAMNATVGQVYPSEFNKNGKKVQSVMLTDGQGIQHKVKLFIGQAPDITPGSTGVFLVGPNPYENKMYYSGFVQGQLQGGQPQQQAPAQQQAPQQPQAGFLPKPPAQPQQGYQPPQMPQQDSVQARIAHAQSLNIANLQLCHGVIQKTQLKETAEVWEKILNTKQWPFDMSMQSPQSPQQPAAPVNDGNYVPPEDTTGYGATLEQDIPF